MPFIRKYTDEWSTHVYIHAHLIFTYYIQLYLIIFNYRGNVPFYVILYLHSDISYLDLINAFVCSTVDVSPCSRWWVWEDNSLKIDRNILEVRELVNEKSKSIDLVTVGYQFKATTIVIRLEKKSWHAVDRSHTHRFSRIDPFDYSKTHNRITHQTIT